MQEIRVEKIRQFLLFLADIVTNRYLILQLAKRDFRNRYLASYLGLPWAFIQPGISIGVMWFVFTFGFKTGLVTDGIPFAPWLIVGMVPWLYLSEAVTSSTNSLMDYGYLIKKVNFRSSFFPLIKIFTALFIHAFFICLIVIVSLVYGYKPTLHWLQLLYYLAAMLIFLTGIGWLTSSLTVFVRDIGQFVGVVMQLVFWLTPIIWHPSMMTKGSLKYVVYLNPIFYLTNGYRETFLYGVWFFEHRSMTIYFWGITACLFVTGALVFRKLKPHFADVL